ncbi:MAG TPA: helix-turn-helix domain-containing protein [Phototrophicaceae bacterium]|nr:helix-turn-helix domain-containing protein [Phototrophicaceae bacterium]
MTLCYEERASDSPFVDNIWRTRPESDGSNIVLADAGWDMMIVKFGSKPVLSVWGPTTKAQDIPYTEGIECIGVQFKLGAFIPQLPINQLVDTGLRLPDATRKSFWLGSMVWQFPDYDNVETFVDQLVRNDILLQDPVVEAILQDECGYNGDLSSRSVQRRFLNATGLPYRSIRQIETAHKAAALLQQGVSILDTVFEAGYYDQQHLTKTLKQITGRTPAQLLLTENT